MKVDIFSFVVETSGVCVAAESGVRSKAVLLLDI